MFVFVFRKYLDILIFLCLLNVEVEELFGRKLNEIIDYRFIIF